MKQTRKSTGRVSKRPNAQPSNNLRKRIILHKAHIIEGVLTLVVIGLAVGALLPSSSPLSLASITGKNTDRIAPKLDTLSGNYSVAGEAASTSLLVKYKNNIAQSTREVINKEQGAKTKRHIAPLGVDVVQVDSTDTVGETIRKFKSRAEVEYVEPNYLAKRFLTPNDTLFPKQWHLQKIGAPAAWDISQGGYGPIAVIDTGISITQSDLSGSVLTGFNFVNDTTDTNDDNGHGTHVAGIISASSNNANGIASIGFKGSLLPVKVLDNTGAGSYGDVASGIIFATDKGAKIINLSLGGSSSSRTMQDAVNYALSRGVIVVAAAGNNGNNIAVYPAAYQGVVAVTASDQNDNLASFSSYGNHIYISAPGAAIISTFNTGGYATLSGTSMAAPEVAGLIGLALSKGTSTTAVLNDLKSTSDKVGPYGYDQNGWNQYFGYGRVNAARLLGAAAVAPPVTTEPTETNDKTKSNNRSSRTSKTSGENSNLSFDTVIEGSIDSVDSPRAVVVVKVKSSSSNLELRADNLIDLYVKQDTVIKQGSNALAIGSLSAGDSLKIKAQWKDNQLNAQEIQLIGKSSGQGNGKR